jgi:DNA repair protein RecO
MSYQTYTTEAIVCGTFNRNTADRSYLLFTKEAGMLYADARSAREERSRQRMSLQDFSYVRVSLVKGKSSWKIGSIEPRGNFFMEACDKAARGSVVSLTKFLRRFYGSEEALPDLFDYFKGALTVVQDTVSSRTVLEHIIMVKLLKELGYVDARVLPGIADEPVEDLATRSIGDDVEATLAPLIDKAVSLSHL